ncbi:MAG: bifunctional folylpolyglutamate synthase/dihydrofolate synthase [Gemmatimonadales bacterium]|nr:bifunctional folylpolyglutamate synthase/dihydrofolate synthase [Gemmatimonadales bacterium]MDQ3426926.1 Mur ligase family protein [Gemmatimonadota bacterium]
MTLAYDQALEFLFPRTTTIKFGLATTRALLLAVGNPHQVIPSVHIGGTNGKGSVSTLVAAALREAGWRVGLYTSPHLVSFRERIRVDGVPISEAAVAMWTERLRPLILERRATFFEASTALAFADFAARGVEIAVVEVGLGGRLDSTNVVHPLVSAVTKIERDHMKYLGHTLEKIACEKAGIAKPRVPFVVGERDPVLVEVLRREARRAVARRGGRADIRVLPPDYEWCGPLSLAGPHQRRNAAVAHGILMALPTRYRPSARQLATGFGAARIPGRLDRRGKWLFDVAHNPDGMRALTAALDAGHDGRPIHALVSILGDKEWPEMLVQLDRAIDRGVLTIAPSAAGRGWDMDWLRRWLQDPSRPSPRAVWTLIPEFHEALKAVQDGAGTVLVTGSFHTVGDVMKVLSAEC